MKAITNDMIYSYYFSEKWMIHDWKDTGGLDHKDISLAEAACIFNSGVNFGPVWGVRLAQRAIIRCGVNVSTDGKLGPQTINALIRISDDDFIENFIFVMKARYDFLAQRNKNLRTFLKGWHNRANDLARYCEENTDRFFVIDKDRAGEIIGQPEEKPVSSPVVIKAPKQDIGFWQSIVLWFKNIFA